LPRERKELKEVIVMEGGGGKRREEGGGKEKEGAEEIPSSRPRSFMACSALSVIAGGSQ